MFGNSNGKSLIELHTAILLAACSSIFGKLVSMNPVMITWYRMFFSAIMLGLLLACSSYRNLVLRKKDIRLLLTGALLAVHWVFFYASIKYANVSVGVVCFSLSGFFTALVAPVINRRKVSLSEIGLSSLTLVGVLMIFHFDGNFRTGIILGIVSSLLFAVYAVFNGKVNNTGNVGRNTLMQMLGGTIIIILLMPVCQRILHTGFEMPKGIDLGYLIVLALLCTVCMCNLLNNAQKRISAFTVSLSFNLEPVYSIFLAILIFHEDRELTVTFLLGLSLIMLSLVLQMLRVIRTKNTITNQE